MLEGCLRGLYGSFRKLGYLRVPLKGYYKVSALFFSLVVWAALRFVLRGRRGTFEHKVVLGP